jgi:6-pyruvoyltetrahydropterin/6-carboxytetrahydropterin synthase
MPNFRVRVTKDYTVFCAGHFITYEGDKCEALHGHNYRAAVSLEGELGESFYVFDFVTLKKMLRGICDRLDHRMLLPLHNPHLELSQAEGSLLVRYRDKKYVFPQEEVVLLPIQNTTAEKLAEWIGGELETELRQRGLHGLRAMEVEVEESFGQSAVCRVEFGRDEREGHEEDRQL